MSAIERIKGYCCEVTPEQWRELVKVADDVGCPVGIRSRRQGPDSNRGHAECFNNGVCEMLVLKRGRNHESIPFDSFLAKLRGEQELPHIGRDTSLHTQKVEDVLVDAEPWTPKVGEMVLIDRGMREENWVKVKFIGCNDAAFVWFDPHSRPTYGEAKTVRPLNYRPRMTKAEAQEKLNCIITD